MKKNNQCTSNKKIKVAWLIPEFLEGSGGHRTILIHAKNLEDHGYECSIYIEGNGRLVACPKQEVKKMFGLDFERISYGWDLISECDIAIATVWYSARFVRDIQFNCKKIYFIQDYEPWFNQMGDGHLLAELSYTYGLIPITIGNWLRHKLYAELLVKALSYNFGVDQEIYKQIDIKTDNKAICMVYQPEKPRRCPLIGIEALGIVKNLRPETKIYLYGSKLSSAGNIWFEHTNLGLLSKEKCNELYNKCSVGLCLSSSNPSRIPFEMMASGLPVVELKRENNFYDLPDSCISLAMASPESIASKIINIMDNPEIREEKCKNALSFVSDRDAASELSKFKNIIDEVINEKIIFQSLPQKISGMSQDETAAFISTIPASPKFSPIKYPRLPLGLRRLARKLRAILRVKR